jgi:hypothetical protein
LFVLTLGVFIVALFMSGEAGEIAQALGNVIGAAIGAVGAAGAVVWQMGRQERSKASELRELRRVAFAGTNILISERLFYCTSAVHRVLAGNIDAAAHAFSGNAIGAFKVDPELASRLKISAPADIPSHQHVRDTYTLLFTLAQRIHRFRGGDRPQADVFLAHGIVAFVRAAESFLIGRNLVEAEDQYVLIAFRDLRDKLLPITSRYPEIAYSWPDWTAGQARPRADGDTDTEA